MKRILPTLLAMSFLGTAAFAQQAPVKQTPAALLDSGLTVGDCLVVLDALNKMDEIERTKPFDFAKGGLRLDIARNMAALSAVRTEAQPAQQKIFFEVLKTVPEVDGKPVAGIPPGTPAAAEYDRQLRELTAKPCRAYITRINAVELNLEKNPQISLGVLAGLDKILDR